MTERNQRLTTVGFIATILVVMCHADQGFLPVENRSWLLSYFGKAFSDANVSNFFALSGYFLALNFGRVGWWKNAVLKRCRTLLIPYFCWAIIFGLLALMSCCAYKILMGRSSGNEFGGMLGILGLYPHNGPTVCVPLWYVKTLFYYVLISPIVFWILAKWRLSIVVVAVLLYVLYVEKFMGQGCYVLSVLFHREGFVAFCAGAYCALHPFDLKWAKSKWVFIGALAAWLGASAIEKGLLGLPVNRYFWPINVWIATMALQLCTLSCSWRVPERFCRHTFFVFCTHYWVLGWFAMGIKTMQRHGWFIGGWDIFLYGGVVMLTLVCCYFCAIAVRRIFPRGYAVLTGGR